MPLTIAELETPIPVVDLDRLARNLDRAAEYATAHGLGLRPHIKTHKSPRIAGEQLTRGAVGVTCATPYEAEVMSEVCNDILVAYPPVGRKRAARLAALAKKVRLTVALDSIQAVDDLAHAATEAGSTIGVCVELDLGMHRVGLPVVDDAIALARAVRERPSLSSPASRSIRDTSANRSISKHSSSSSCRRRSARRSRRSTPQDCIRRP